MCVFSLFQVVILSSKPLPIKPQRSVGEVSFIEAERKRKTLSDTNRMSTSAGSYSSLEDVQVRQKKLLFFFFTPSFIRGGVIKNHLCRRIMNMRKERV